MATLRKRSNGHWQARVRKAKQTLTKTFIHKADAEKWAKQVAVELDKGSYTNLMLAERKTFAELIERNITEAAPAMREDGAGPTFDCSPLYPIDQEQLNKTILKALTRQ